MSAHTPAPWLMIEPGFIYALNDDDTNRFDACISAGELSHDKRGRKRDRTSNEEILANTKLMHAAPDLFESLKEMFDLFCDQGCMRENWDDHFHKAKSQARAAIAKATGGES